MLNDTVNTLEVSFYFGEQINSMFGSTEHRVTYPTPGNFDLID